MDPNKIDLVNMLLTSMSLCQITMMMTMKTMMTIRAVTSLSYRLISAPAMMEACALPALMIGVFMVVQLARKMQMPFITCTSSILILIMLLEHLVLGLVFLAYRR